MNINTDSKHLTNDNEFKKINEFFDFSNKNGILLGYLRGPCFSSRYLRNLMKVEPFFLDFKFIQEIWVNGGSNFSIDVEFGKGKDLIEHFKNFKIFRLPIVDIISLTEKLVGKKIHFEKIKNESIEFLSLFKKGNLGFVWGFDENPLNKSFDLFLEEEDLSTIKDLLNFYFLNLKGKVDLIEEYRERKKSFLKGKKDILSELLTENYGTIIYNEDVVEVISNFTGLDYTRSDIIRRKLKNDDYKDLDWEQISKILGLEISSYLLKSIKNTFSKAHLLSTFTIIRKSIILRNYFEDEYLNSKKIIEQKFSVPWNYFEI